MSPISWLQETGFFQPPRPPLSSNRRFKQLLIRKERGMLRLEMNSIETIVQPQGRFLKEGSSRDIQNNIFELFCRYWNPHQVGETNCMLLTKTDPRPIGTRRLMMLTPTYLTTKPIRRMSTSWSCPCPLGSITIKLFTTHLQVGTYSFEGISFLWPPFACKATQLSILFY